MTALGWEWQKALANHQEELAKTVERHKVELGAMVEQELRASRQEAAREIQPRDGAPVRGPTVVSSRDRR